MSVVSCFFLHEFVPLEGVRIWRYASLTGKTIPLVDGSENFKNPAHQVRDGESR